MPGSFFNIFLNERPPASSKHPKRTDRAGDPLAGAPGRRCGGLSVRSPAVLEPGRGEGVARAAGASLSCTPPCSIVSGTPGAPRRTRGGMEFTEEDLVRRARGRDRDAFRQLVERYRERVYGIARGMTGNHADADDVAQETFIRAYRKLDDFEGRARFCTWLYRIAVNCSLDLLRKRSRRAEFDLGDAGGVEGSPPRGDGTAGTGRHTASSSRRSRGGSSRCPRGTARCSCSTTWRGCRTTRSAPCWGARRGRCAPGSTTRGGGCSGS